MSTPKSLPRELPFLNTKEEELNGPQEDPRTVCQVHHAVCFVPFQFVLYVYSGFGLYDEGDE